MVKDKTSDFYYVKTSKGQNKHFFTNMFRQNIDKENRKLLFLTYSYIILNALSF